MQELVTDAFVLGSYPSKRAESFRIDVLTQKMGRLSAKVVSGLKLNSKLSPHLDVLNLVRLRLVNKNDFLVTDALTIHRFEEVRKDMKSLSAALDLIFLIRSLNPEFYVDEDLWQKMFSSLKYNNIDISSILGSLGYGTSSAECHNCKEPPSVFLPKDQIFFCTSCSKSIEDDVKLVI